MNAEKKTNSTNSHSAHNQYMYSVANTKQIIENVALEKQFLAIGFWGLIII